MIDNSSQPYRGRPLPFAQGDHIVPGVIDVGAIDDELWVPQAEGVSFLPLLLSPSQGYFVNVLRVRRSGVLSRHRHAGPVHALTLKGRWHYLEHDWWAEEGSYSYEPPGDIHTLEVPDDVDEMVTWFHVSGAYVYVDPDGNVLGIEDVFSKIEKTLEHDSDRGIGTARLEACLR
ncbi:MAG: cupin [Ilumatobacter sp.]|nr:MAG: cupin [Ilumatobacter sp.]